MWTKNHQFCVCTLLMVIVSSCALGQQPTQEKGESTKYRKIGTFAGLGGGFALGVFVGFAAFDDATNAERKITITALASAAAGALGGYFLGRAIDKRKSPVTWMWMPNELDRSLMRARSLAYGWQTALLPSQVGKLDRSPPFTNLLLRMNLEP